MTGPLGAGPFYRGKSRAIKIPRCGPATAAEPVRPGGAVYYGKSRAIKAGPDVRSTGPRPPVQAQGPVYHGVSRALKVRSCPIYVAGAQYGATFDGAPEWYGEPAGPPYYWEGGVTAFVTSFQGAINDPATRKTWSVPLAPYGNSSEIFRIAADGDGVIVQYVGGLGSDDSWRLEKYTADGDLIWGPIVRPHDTFHIGLADGLAYTCFGFSTFPLLGNRTMMINATTGDIVWELNLTDMQLASGATKSRGARVVVMEQTAAPTPMKVFHRVGAGGIEASAAVPSTAMWIDPTGGYGGAGIDYYGGLHADPDRFYVWLSSSFPPNSYERVEEWQSYPTVQKIRTIWAYAGLSSILPGADSLAFDEVGDFYRKVDRLLTGSYVEKRSGVDGTLIWTTPFDPYISDDATQFISQNGLVYVSGFNPRDDLPQGLLPVLVILDATTGEIVEPQFNWGEDALASSDIYGLATP